MQGRRRRLPAPLGQPNLAAMSRVRQSAPSYAPGGLHLTDRELLEGLRRGRQEAFDTIFRTHYPELVGAAERLLRGRGQAEEVVQDVMLELWRRRESLAIDESLRAYLFRATRNRALNVIRHERVVQAAAPYVRAEHASAAEAEPNLLQGEIDAALADALRTLPPRCREIFELSRVQGLRYSDIASVLGLSVKTVEAQMGKALRLLREQLASWLPDAGDPEEE